MLRSAASKVMWGARTAALMVVLVVIGVLSVAHADTTFTVNTTGDQNDLDFPAGTFDGTSDGVCDVDGAANGEQCTLRAAIQEANVISGADIINFALSGTPPWTVDLTEALPDLSTNIEIVGPGADQLTVTRPDTAEPFRIFTVTGDTTEVTISGMTVSNGNTVGLDDDRGGGISNVDDGTLTITDSIISGNTAEDDGAIRNLGTLEVSNSTLSGNTSNGTAGGIYNDNGATATVSDSTFSGNSAPDGGGIFNSGGTLEVNNSTFSGNRSTVGYGGAFANGSSSTATVSDSTFSENSAVTEGGAIRNDGTLEVNNSTFSGNSAPNGGGLWHGSQTSLTVTDSTFSENSATEGAGIFNRGGGTVTVNNSTFSENSANLRGGGIFSDTNLSGETTTITNSTISGNTAQTSGGGVYNTDGLTVIKFSTITNNSVKDAEGTILDDQGSGVASVGNDRTSTEVLSTIISDNTNTDVDFVNDPTNTFVSRDYNLIGNGNATGAFNQPGDQVIGDDTPGLGPLSDNDGPTETHALLAGSPAIDAGPPADGDPVACPPPDTDQRGVVRPQDGDGDGTARCDTGSFELEVPENQAPTVRVGRGGVCGPASDSRGTINLALSDPDDSPEDLILTATSSNRAVVPNGSISLGGGTDASRTLTVRRLTGTGPSTLTVTVSDGDLRGSVEVRVVSGSAANNTLSGSAESDMIFARKGIDTAGGGRSNDLLCGGNGRDTLRGAAGADTVQGGYNDDELTGGPGADRFVGASGTDTATDFDADEGDTKRGIERF